MLNSGLGVPSQFIYFLVYSSVLDTEQSQNIFPVLNEPPLALSLSG